jgi:O-antigen/teichoic acid export membrane protein
MIARFQNWSARWRRHDGFHIAYDSAVLIVGSGLTAALFALFHAITGRLMNPEDYALFLALLALLNVLCVPANVVSTTMTRYVAGYVQRDDSATWLLLLRRGLRLVLPWGVAALGLWCLAAPWLRTTLKSPSAASVAMVGMIAFVGLVSPFLGGALTGSRRFGWSVTSGVGTAVSRLLLATAVALLGGGVTWMLGTVAGSTIIGVLLMWWPLRQVHHIAPTRIAELPGARAVQGYFWAVLLGQIALFLLLQADMILLPRFLVGDELAAYGKAAQLARAVFFLPLPIVAAMFPRAVTSSNPRLLLGPVVFTLAVCLLAAAAMTAFPALPMRLLYGISEPLHLTLTRWYVWAVIPLALINLIAPYLWARHEVVRTLWLIPVTLGYLGLLYRFHATPHQIILCLLAGGLAALLTLGIITWRIFAQPATFTKTPTDE